MYLFTINLYIYIYTTTVNTYYLPTLTFYIPSAFLFIMLLSDGNSRSTSYETSDSDASSTRYVMIPYSARNVPAPNVSSSADSFSVSDSTSDSDWSPEKETRKRKFHPTPKLKGSRPRKILRKRGRPRKIQLGESTSTTAAITAVASVGTVKRNRGRPRKILTAKAPVAVPSDDAPRHQMDACAMLFIRCNNKYI